jgi:hypothetical protein
MEKEPESPVWPPIGTSTSEECVLCGCAVLFDAGLDMNICIVCGARETAVGWRQGAAQTVEKNNCGHLAIDGHGRCESCFEYLPNPPEGFNNSLVEGPAALDPSDAKVLRARWAALFGEPEDYQKAMEALFPSETLPARKLDNRGEQHQLEFVFLP